MGIKLYEYRVKNKIVYIYIGKMLYLILKSNVQIISLLIDNVLFSINICFDEIFFLLD